MVISTLIGAHAFLGELGILMFIWVFIEMLNPDKKSLKRIKIAAMLGIILFFASWFVGGFYYVEFYGDVKPLIKEGPQPWAHLVGTETKEHVFFFLPFLSIFTYGLIKRYEKSLADNKNKKARISVMIMSALIVVIGALMALLGFIISTGVRTALEAGV